MEHIYHPARTYTTPEKHIYRCAGWFHDHRTRAAAVVCENRQSIWVKGRTRVNNGDGTATIIDWTGDERIVSLGEDGDG